MSKRHQASRRKAYGRRQHEVRERDDRRRLDRLETSPLPADVERPEDFAMFGLGLGGRHFRFALGD